MVLPKVLVKALLQRYFGRGDVGEVTKDGSEAPHADELGEGDAGVDGEAPPVLYAWFVWAGFSCCS